MNKIGIVDSSTKALSVSDDRGTSRRRKSSSPAAGAAPRARVNLWVLGILIGVAALWQIASSTHLIDKKFVSDPLSILTSLGRIFTDATALTAIGQTLYAVVVSFVLGAIIGIVLGFFIGLNATVRAAYFPIVRVLMGIPTVVFLPLLILAFGLSTTAGIAFATLVSFVQVVVNVVAGIDLIDPKYYRVAHAFNASKWHLFFHVVVSGAAPGIFAGLYHGLRNSFIGVVIAQLYISAAGGVGFLVYLWTNNFQIDDAMALILLMGAIVIIVGTSWKFVEARVTSWQQR